MYENMDFTMYESQMKDEEDETIIKSRELIFDPQTGRGFVFSTDQAAQGKPEYLFLDTPADLDFMNACCKIITDYQNGVLDSPQDLQVVVLKPWKEYNDDSAFPFVARVLLEGNGRDARLKRMLEQNFLYHANTRHGLVVMIPLAQNPHWDQGKIPVPEVCTGLATDVWIQTVANLTGAYMGNENQLMREQHKGTIVDVAINPGCANEQLTLNATVGEHKWDFESRGYGK